jgi:outer membrane lipoprotein carrier protein
MATKSKFAVTCLILLLVPCIASVGTAQNGPAAVVAAVEQHYRTLTDLQAKVVQKNFLKSLNKTQTFEGTLWIKKPGRLRLEYTNGQLILVDGKEALFYSKKSEQVIKRSFTDFEQMNIPVAFLLGAGQITDSFEVVKSGDRAKDRIELVPKKAGAAMQKLVIRADESGRIMELAIYDRSGNRTEITFSDVREDAGVDDHLFRFVPPKGTEVIEQ